MDPGWTDLYVANDGEANHLWLNQQNGRFVDTALTAGVALSEDGMPQAGMGLAAGDYDNDGDEDLVVTNLSQEGASLYRNEGNAVFSDVSAPTGMRRMTFANTGFGTGLLDYDSDGCLDLFIANGAVTIMDSQRGQPDPFRQPLQLLRGTCGSFQPAPGISMPGIGRGAAFGDLDNDGDLDIVVTHNNAVAQILLNNGNPKAWLRVIAPAGAVVRAISSTTTFVRVIRADGSYLSSSESAALFSGTAIREVQVQWPDGKVERWSGVGMNQSFAPEKGTGKPVP